MNRFQLLSDLRDVVRVCLGADCLYKLIIARGEPTVECNQIAFWFGDETISHIGDCEGDWCEEEFETPVFVKLSRICLAPLGDIDRDLEAEESEALCFYRDVELIECCLADSTKYAQIRADHAVDSITRISTSIEGSVQGGAFSATIRLRIKGTVCCDAEG